ncbi:hypothetical protein ALP03_200007 [Pseudomonas amygdali pv. tabaci]|uniref:Uncharacterized protein n=1 Tax=Pseudomonas amygdali pv. tabaci TaxID=322 RepID=A0A3M6HDM2_PSEAJ|nr:hypothetical protein ALP03_200007 [Pseudomonas amygdali pv. tabaci]
MQRFALGHAFDEGSGVKLKPLTRITGSAPRVTADHQQRSGTRAGPGLGQFAIQRVKIQTERFAQRP